MTSTKIILFGWDREMGIVATETTDTYWHARQIAGGWKDAGLLVEILEVTR